MYQLRNDIRYKEKENEDNADRLANLDREQRALVDRTGSLNNLLDSKCQQLEKTSAQLDSTNRDLAVLQSSINALDVDINEAERQNDRALEHQKKLLR